MSTDGRDHGAASRSAARDYARSIIDKSRELTDEPEDYGGTVHHAVGNTYYVHLDGDPPDNAVPFASAIGILSIGERVLCRMHGGRGSYVTGRQSGTGAVLPGYISTYPSVSVSATSSQTLTIGTFLTQYDTSNFATTSGGFVTIPSRYGGVYSIHAEIVESSKGSLAMNFANRAKAATQVTPTPATTPAAASPVE